MVTYRSPFGREVSLRKLVALVVIGLGLLVWFMADSSVRAEEGSADVPAQQPPLETTPEEAVPEEWEAPEEVGKKYVPVYFPCRLYPCA